METNRTKTKKLSVLNAPSSKQNRKQHTQHSKPPQQTPTQIRDKMLKQKHNHFYNSINITALIKNNLVMH